MRMRARSKHHSSVFTVLQLPLAVPVLLLYLIVGAFVARFLSGDNIKTILFSAAVLLPVVLTTQLLLILGRFDLSIGATASLAGMVTGVVFRLTGSLPLAVCCGMAAGAIVGCTAGALVARLEIDPLIATLALMGMARSVSLVLTDGRIVTGLPDILGQLIRAEAFHLPLLIPAAFGCTVCAAWSVRHVVFFRRFYAAGNNSNAASNAGVRVESLIVWSYALAGLGAALTGVIQISRTLSASPLLFDTLAIDTIAACILGGSSLNGGRGGVWGALLGLLVIVATDNLVTMLGISVYWKDCAVGALLLIAVLGRPISSGLNHFIMRKASRERTRKP